MKRIAIFLLVMVFTLLSFCSGASAQTLPLTPILVGGHVTVPPKGIVLQPGVPFSYEVVYQTPGELDNLIAIVYPTYLYVEVVDEITAVATDLESGGYQVFIITYEGDGLEAAGRVRAVLQDRWDWGRGGLVGVFGKLPVVWFEMPDDFDGYATFPIPLYYGDLNGVWEDNDRNGIFDAHLGDINPEIWFGITDFSSLAPEFGSEAELLRIYLQKFHAEWNLPPQSNKAVVYVDNDWVGLALGLQMELSKIYSDVKTVSEPSETQAADYLDELRFGGYDFVVLWAHGNIETEGFRLGPGDPGFGGGYIVSGDIMSLNPRPSARFYVVASCYNANYTGMYSPDDLFYIPYIGGSYLSVGKTLAVVSSTKSGGMSGSMGFYDSLARGEDLGKAFLMWWTAMYDYIWVHWNDQLEFRRWIYGMTILGIPAVRTGITPPLLKMVARVVPSQVFVGKAKTIKVFVTDEAGFPLAGASVNLGGRVAYTSKKGVAKIKVRFSNAGSQLIVVEKTGFARVTISLEVVVRVKPKK